MYASYSWYSQKNASTCECHNGIDLLQSAKTLKEILDLKDDPEAAFSEKTRQVHQAMFKKRKTSVDRY